MNATGATHPFFAGGPAANIRFSNNQVTCGTSTCAFFVGSPRSLIADNRFTANGSATGVHIQPSGSGAINPDDTRVERNWIVATAPSGSPDWGGIRVVGGTDVVIAYNTVLGPWQNSISITSPVVPPFSAIKPIVAANRLEGALLWGIRFGAVAGWGGLIRVRDGVFRHNRVRGAGIAGVLAFRACNNRFVGNDLQGNLSGVGIQFVTPGGGNTFVGNETVAVDGAAPFDCNGDGVPDPNTINGRGAVLNGVNLGGLLSDAIVESNGIVQ